MGNVQILVEPASEPVTVDEMFLQGHYNTNEENAQLTEEITNARKYIETYCGIKMITQHLRQWFEPWHKKGFRNLDRSLLHHRVHNQLSLDYSPVASIIGVYYLDVNNNPVMLTVNTDYTLNQYNTPVTIQLKTRPPYNPNAPKPVYVDYIAGLDTADPLDKKMVRMLAEAYFKEGRSALTQKSVVRNPAFQDLLNQRSTNVFGRN